MAKLRAWKAASKTKGSASNVGPASHASWEQRTKERAEKSAAKAAQQSIDDEVRAHKQMAKERREAKEKRKEENKMKGLQYQVIADSRKIKKMSRKQLKLIRKADTTGVKPILAAEKKRKK